MQNKLEVNREKMWQGFDIKIYEVIELKKWQL